MFSRKSFSAKSFSLKSWWVRTGSTTPTSGNSAWGISWGDSWGDSWWASASNPLPEELRYYGNGSRSAARNSNDDGLIQIVADKWEAIERARAEDAKTGADEADWRLDADKAQLLAESTGASADAASAADEAIEAARRRAVRNDEALILILASL